MNKNENIILAYFDVLGSKEKLYQLGLKQYLLIYEKLRQIIVKGRGRLVLDATVNPHLNKDGSITAGTAMYSFDADHTFFSDSIVFWIKHDVIRFKDFSQLCAEFFCEILNLGIPMRGGISIGEAYMNKRKKIFVGRPLVEAVKVEQSQKWLGMSFGNSFDVEPYKYLFLHLNSNILFFQEHKKEGYAENIPGFVLDWPSQWEKMYNKSLLKQLAELNIDSRYQEYYDNTIKFVKVSQDYNNESFEELLNYIKQKSIGHNSGP